MIDSHISRALVAFVATIATTSTFAFEPFSDETAAIAHTIKCPAPKITNTPGMADLWGCIIPGAEVVKVFVNADDANASVRNVKIMWNDWTRDTGYGVHTDKAMAEAWLTALATRYAPEQVAEVLAAFRGAIDTTIAGNGVNLTYTYFKGPAIDERLVTITK
ncbi:MAG: hypothetical protein EOO81_04725 [Oxalobacteraceae bacterium]|nr:MAG: hypothetical protein EOO81_04725 [Oxalobacteraceae bacterium]